MSTDDTVTNQTVPSGEEQPGKDSFAIVGVGASAGGLEAFTQLLAALPINTGLAFVLVQHLDPTHESNLREILSRATRIPVTDASQDLAVQPDHIYVIRPNTSLTISQGVLQVAPRGQVPGLHLPIDHFLRSLAADRRTGAIGVILSGSGTDGTLGVEEIKAAGGITFAQDEQSAKYASMPQSAIRSGCIDLVLSPEEIAAELTRIGQHSYVLPSEPEEHAAPSVSEEHSPPLDDDHFNRILALLRASSEVDFGGYRDATIKRRISRRMVLHKQDSLAGYAEYLKRNRPELDALYDDILINVTSFFREPETFEALKQKVFPAIMQGKNANTPVRIWAPGCSTGQEAYSLAIALLEYLDDKALKPAIQIFASDLRDNSSLQRAREGIYPENIEAEVSAERLRRFFTKEGSKYRVNKTLRDSCIFAKQNVATDPPFSRLDLISCRNLLIYLTPPVQKRIIPTFHYALNTTGFLMLGASEAIGGFADLFEVLDQKRRIYSKKASTARQYPHFNATQYMTGSERVPMQRPVTAAVDWQHEADRIALGQYAPAGVLVNESFDILQFRGETGAYLAPAPGEPSHSLFKMAREGLFQELRSALNECREKGTSVRRQGVLVRGSDRAIDVHVLPIKLPRTDERCFLILFEETAQRASSPKNEIVTSEPSKRGDSAEAAVIEQELAATRQELASTREYLESVIDQHATANEELKSANEEILSGNEELQSTNEELETSKEELQSVNEELTTVNEQLQHRNQELSRLSDALNNVQASANVPMLELSIDLRVRSFTPAAGKVLNLAPEDIGRLLENVRLSIEVPDFKALVTEVIDTVQVKEQEVRDHNGRWYALRVHPYSTEDKRIDGAVAVFEDITERKQMEDYLRRSAEELLEADRRKNEFLAMLAHELRNPLAPIRNGLAILNRISSQDEQPRQTREMMERQLEHITRLLDDLLDITRITSGKIELHKERVELANVVKQAVETCDSMLEAAGHELAIQLPTEPLVLHSDPVRLVQIIENLLTNAIKYSVEGGGRIDLLVEREGTEAVVRVNDRGIGISSEMLPRIWDLFVQAEPNSGGSRGGLGIGLTVARQLVHLHGGSIDVQSAGLGQGSEFTVRLSLAQEDQKITEAKTSHTDSSSLAPPKRTIVVDDNPDEAESLGTLLRLMGNDVRVFYDGPAALEVISSFEPEVAFLDIGMPKMDGYELARSLRRALGPQLLLIAVTGYGMAEDRRRSLDAGFDEHLVKPPAPDSLQALVSYKK